MLQWIRTEATKLWFNIIIASSYSGSYIRHSFVKMRCKRSDKYKDHVWNSKCSDTEMRKRWHPFKLCGTTMRIIHGHLMCFDVYVIVLCVTSKSIKLIMFCFELVS